MLQNKLQNYLLAPDEELWHLELHNTPYFFYFFNKIEINLGISPGT